MMTTKISIVEDFHPFPAGRFGDVGDGSGEEFRNRILLPMLEAGEEVEIDLDGAPGYPSSFLEEAFGGLVRDGKVTAEQVRTLMSLHASERYVRYIRKIWTYIADAEKLQLKN